MEPVRETRWVLVFATQTYEKEVVKVVGVLVHGIEGALRATCQEATVVAVTGLVEFELLAEGNVE